MDKKPTKYYSSIQEEHVADVLGGQTNAQSGAGLFKKGDVLIPRGGILCECKTCTTDKESFSIKKEWIEKNKMEAFQMRMSNSCIAFNFGPNDKSNYYVIDEKLMKYLVDKLEEDFKK